MSSKYLLNFPLFSFLTSICSIWVFKASLVWGQEALKPTSLGIHLRNTQGQKHHEKWKASKAYSRDSFQKTEMESSQIFSICERWDELVTRNAY